MTDHYAVVNPEDLTPVQTAQGPHTCELCQRTFQTATALGVHFRSHGTNKQPCPDCGLEYYPGPGMSRHRQTAHGAAKANGQAAKSSVAMPAKGRRKACPDCGKLIGSKDMARHRRLHVGRAPEAPAPVQAVEHEPVDLTEDDLFTAAIGMLFPNGQIPVAKVEALFKWRDATRRMLQDVYGGNWG